MRSSSDDFEEAIRSAPKLSTTVLLEEPDGTITPIPILGGSVTLDGTATSRASASLQVTPDLVPALSSDPLAPYSNKVHVSRGVRYSNDLVEEITLGTFHIDSTTGEDTGSDLPVSVNLLDFSQRIADAVMEDPGQIDAGTECTDAIQTLVLDVLPDCEFDFIDPVDVNGDPITLPLLNYEDGDDRWEMCQDIADACQCDLYFSSTGVLTLRLHPEAIEPDLEVFEGGILVSASKTWNRAETYNRVVVNGQNTGGPDVRGVAIDDDALSPTQYGPEFGRRTFPWSSDYVTTQVQADATAQYILSLKRGIGQEISLGAVVDPRLEPFDVIAVKRDRLSIDGLYIVDSLTIPLQEAEMSIETRTSRVYA